MSLNEVPNANLLVLRPDYIVYFPLLAPFILLLKSLFIGNFHSLAYVALIIANLLNFFIDESLFEFVALSGTNLFH